MPNLASLQISIADLLNFESAHTLYGLPADVNYKISEASKLLKSSYIIDKSLYDNVFITSDIHSDLVKLDFLLMNAGLVRKVSTAETAALPEHVRLVSESIWVASRTLLIIVGDLIDGRREMYGVVQTVPDPKGNIELLLHAYLYNMRIQARELGSEIRFTIGNHDYHTVIRSDSSDYPKFYKAYVHETAQAFFGARERRINCLLPFYNCCPYLFLTIGDEIACVHGGLTMFSYSGFLDATPFLRALQEQIDLKNSFSVINRADDQLLSRAVVFNKMDGYEGSPLWSRRYAQGTKEEVCATIDSNYKMVVVGHCQTGYECCVTGKHTAAILAQAEYTKYNCHMDGGCVLLGCENQGGPHLAFVDIAMSRSFNPTKPLASRAEFLLLLHNPALPTDRYYNVIIRKNVGRDGTRDEVVWAASASVTGGRKKKKLGRITKKSKRKQYNR
jgi:hypothetical protein